MPDPCCRILRLLERGRRYQEKLAEAQRQADEAPRDAATGLPLFHPKTHRPPQYERNPEGGCRGVDQVLEGCKGWEQFQFGWVGGWALGCPPPRCSPAACWLARCSCAARLWHLPNRVRLPLLFNLTGAPIGEYLYSIKAEWEQKAAAVRGAQERRAARNASSTFVNDRSEVGGGRGSACRSSQVRVQRHSSSVAMHLPDPSDLATATVDRPGCPGHPCSAWLAACSASALASKPRSPVCTRRPVQRLVDRLKRERFRAVFEYLRQCDPAPVVNLLDVVQVGGGGGAWAVARSQEGGSLACSLH